jgi:hypothetical protein
MSVDEAKKAATWAIATAATVESGIGTLQFTDPIAPWHGAPPLRPTWPDLPSPETQ